MSVVTSLPEVRSKDRTVQAVAIVVLVLVLAIAGFASWALWIARSALPQVEGTAVLPGLSSKVTVIRDERGAPTIQASTLEDLFFAQGYVTAQERLWQMDILRRAAAGELSEIIGKDTVKLDREQRILGLRVAAEASVKLIPAADRPYFDAYASGVNAFIESHRDRLPIEFRILKYQPRPWTVTDSLLIGARMVQDLNHYSYERALTREKILAKIGPELTADLYVNSSWHDRPPTEALRGMDQEPAATSGDEDNDEDEEVDPDGGSTTLTSSTWFAPSSSLLGEDVTAHFRTDLVFSVSGAQRSEDSDPLLAGSNNWVVSGAHTTTGKPLLSNDMHLDHQMPNLWFEAHLKSGDFDAAGVTLPGVPFVIVGHNHRIGWGFTNIGPTVEDDYIEDFNEQGQYKVPVAQVKGSSRSLKEEPSFEWREPEHRQEIIHVRGMPDVTLDVVTTRHGPIITELIPGETRKIALRWTLYDGMGLMFIDVDRAQNWDEFRQAFSKFIAPGQNVVYADIDGNIGYQATGRVPTRTSGDGSLPVSGSDDAHEWTGYIPFEDMPHTYDPPTGIIATANGRIVPDGYKYSISTEWEAPWRTDRIYRVLESGKKFAPADMVALQMDVSSSFDHFCADRFVYALDHAPKLSDRAKRAADILRDWDGRMSADSAAPTIETKSRQELARLLLEPKLGAADPEDRGNGPSKDTGRLSWKSYRWAMSTVWLENVLSKQTARWLPPGYSDYDAVLTAAVENALQKPEVPSDITKWKWGQNSWVEIDHPVLSHLPLIGRFTGIERQPISGDHYTVKQVVGPLGPSERLTWNFADFDASTLNLVTGESGVFLSPHYKDQWTAWYGGSTFAFPFSQSAVEKHSVHKVALVPR
jgi:penicillin G amidase